MSKIQIAIQNEPLSLEQLYAHVSDPEHGAVSTFMGTVRNFNLGKTVLGISYDIHKSLAIEALNALAIEAQANWGANLRIYIAHFYGRLEVGEASVLIGVSSPHRKESFLACRSIIEGLKSKAPIWKQEYYIDGSSDWVQGHALCQHA